MRSLGRRPQQKASSLAKTRLPRLVKKKGGATHDSEKGEPRLEASRLDPLSPQERSERMRKIKASGTKPELLVRKIIRELGFRYRLGGLSLPGKPDIVFKSRKKVIFVHGCFWHQHGCGHYKQPQTRLDFWLPKLRANMERDKQVQAELLSLGWDVLIIWECETRGDIERLKQRILDFLGVRYEGD